VQLPIEYQSAAGTPVISVDGAWGAPGLNLSHWPGNRTPSELKADLSTSIALRFAALQDARRAELASGCTAIANNHYDTDGVCALFAVARPKQALELASQLRAAAAAGDFFQWPSDFAYALDATLTALVDVERSPWRDEVACETDSERYTAVTRRVMNELPRMIASELNEYRALWQSALERGHADRTQLAACALDELVHLELGVFSAPPSEQDFDPGRHAVFADGRFDRALLVGPERRSGHTYRFIIGTQSWFDIPDQVHQPRPELAQLCAALNAAEGTSADAGVRWRHQAQSGASPELWFGRAELPNYAEHAGAALAHSSLPPTTVKAQVVDALRAVFVFPEEEELF